MCSLGGVSVDQGISGAGKTALLLLVERLLCILERFTCFLHSGGLQVFELYYESNLEL